MDEPDDGSYAPVSPDLSAYHAPPPAERFNSYQPRAAQRRRSSLDDADYEGTAGYGPTYDPPPPQLHWGGEDGPDEAREGRGRAAGSRRLRKSAKTAVVAAVPVEGDIEIKTKFPVARIKRIMQADEDVGKVSQVTPVAVCKSFIFIMSLLFMFIK